MGSGPTMMDGASHADPRRTMRYDLARASLDRHATYIVAAYLAGGRPLNHYSRSADNHSRADRRTTPSL